jgi:hypothetical protein
MSAAGVITMPEMPQHVEPHWMDPIIEVYKRDVDVTLIDENLKLTPGERIRNLQSAVRGLTALRTAMQESNAKRDRGEK